MESICDTRDERWQQIFAHHLASGPDELPQLLNEDYEISRLYELAMRRIFQAENRF